MANNLLKQKWRKLDNTAKAFSMEDKNLTNTFRLSVILKEKIDSKLLKDAVNKSLEMYPSYKVQMKTGFFWNYLKINRNVPVLETERNKTIKTINLGRNNNYLFKVTYTNNKINLDVCHILTDGVGATIFLKAIVYNYLDLRYNLTQEQVDMIIDNANTQDQYLKNVNRKLKSKLTSKKAFLIKEKANFLTNKTYHYVINLEEFKKICKKNNVSISEYLSALYIYALYNTIYDKDSNEDISVTIPVDLRRHYNVNSFSNFFTSMNINGNLKRYKYMNFKKILNQVKKEFKNKITFDSIQKNLTKEVKLGTNFGISVVPLFIKKPFMKYFGKAFNKSTTTTLSNIGPIKIAEKYKKYIDNILVLVSAGKIQKVKCTICSYDNNLTITINSNLIDNKVEKEFYKLLLKHIGKVKLESSN